MRYTEGTLHGFLLLRTLDDELLADGDLTQTVQGERVTSRLVFRFKDGSLHEQTTVYSQRQAFQLISDHVVQKGAAFPRPLEMSIDATTGRVSVRYQDGRRGTRSVTARFNVPSDLANGIVAKLLMNVRPEAMPRSFSLIAATPTPRLVKLVISVEEETSFLVGGSPRQAAHYVLKPEIGGIAGVLAPLFNRRPPDSHVWIANGDIPAFLRSEQPLYSGGPVWRIELTSPAMRF